MLPCNCEISLSAWEQSTIDNFSSIEDELDRIITLAYKYDKFGKKSTAMDQWIYMQDFVSLYLYLIVIRMQIDRDITDNDIDTPENYYETYQLQCLIDRFNCKEYDITSLLASFRLTRDTISSVEGVDFDYIIQGPHILEVY
jgi:hypothetical protein